MNPKRRAALYAFLATVVAALAVLFSGLLADSRMDPPPLVPVSVPVSAPAVVAPVDVVAPDAPVAVPVEVAAPEVL